MDTLRALRRHHRERLKKTRLNYHGGNPAQGDQSHMTLESRQRQSMADFNRSAFTPTPPCFSREAKRLDAIAAADERDRQQRKAIEAMEGDLIAHAKSGEMKADDARSE